MKNLRVIALSLAILFSANFLVSCYGSFGLTKKVYKWNGSLGSKWINTVVMWVLIIIPVYEIAGWIDWWFLNTIEFWTGSNPLAMKDGDVEIKTVQKDGNFFEIKATKNRFDVLTLTGKDAGKMAALVYNQNESSWSAESNGVTTKLVSMVNENGNNQVKFYMPNNEVAVVNADASGFMNAKNLFNSSSKNLASK